ncbi:MAG: hypothetical protein SF066_02185 [Thermoanaerobaculia bacterium]|nr:hypothetical protein [Thermoanaerobaculia bacterium]
MLEDKLREMLRELGRALADSSDASQALRRIQEEGYSLFFLLDRAGNVPVPAGGAPQADEAASNPAAPRPSIVEPVFRIDGQDLRFLRSLGIDPTRRIRRRGRSSES